MLFERILFNFLSIHSTYAINCTFEKGNFFKEIPKHLYKPHISVFYYFIESFVYYKDKLILHCVTNQL